MLMVVGMILISSVLDINNGLIIIALNINSTSSPQTITFPISLTNYVVPVLGAYYSSSVNDMNTVKSGSLTYTSLQIIWAANNLNVDGSLIVIGI